MTIAKGAAVSTADANAYETIAILGGRNDNVTTTDSNPDFKGNWIPNDGTMSVHGVGKVGATTLRTKTGFLQRSDGTRLVDMTTDGASVAAPSAAMPG